MEEQIRDIGATNLFSMKDGKVFKERYHVFLYGMVVFATSYNYHFKVTPRRYKMHRSIH